MDTQPFRKPKRRRRFRLVVFFALLVCGGFAAWTRNAHNGDPKAAAHDLGLRLSRLSDGVYDKLRETVDRLFEPQDAVEGQSPPTRAKTESWMLAENWTRAKAEDIDSLTPEDIDSIEGWDAQKPKLRAYYDNLRSSVASVLAEPAFRHDNRKLSVLNAALDDFGKCLDGNDPLRIAYDVNPRVTAAANAWKASVVWQSGVRHPTAPHVHSGASRNTWEPDDGYVFANAASDSLDVIYKGHAYRCSHCQGVGSVTQRTTCPKCSGQGRIPNPALTALNTGAAIVDIANALSSKRHSRRPIGRVEDSGLQCPQCQGRRQVAERVDCPYCEGGTVWK